MPTLFFSVQRLLGFRQVVTHIQSRQTVELYFTCRAVTLSKATKVPVVDQYAVQKLSQQENRKTKKQTKNNTGKTLSPCPLELNGILQTPWYQRTLRFFEDGDFLQIYTSTMLHTELATRVTASHRLPGPPHRGELPIAFASDAINRLSLHGFSAQPIGDAAQHFQLCLTAWARDVYIRTNMQEVTVDEILLFLPEEDNVNFYAAQILTPMDALDLYYMITEHLLHSTEDDWKLVGITQVATASLQPDQRYLGVRQRHHFDPWDPTVLTLTTVHFPSAGRVQEDISKLNTIRDSFHRSLQLHCSEFGCTIFVDGRACLTDVLALHERSYLQIFVGPEEDEPEHPCEMQNLNLHPNDPELRIQHRRGLQHSWTHLALQQ